MWAFRGMSPTIHQLAEDLDLAITHVAQCAREVSDTAEPIGSRNNYQVHGEEMDQLREALKVWTDASEVFLAAVKANK